MVNVIGQLRERLDLGINGSNCRPPTPNVVDEARGMKDNGGYNLETEYKFVDFEDNRHHRGSGDAWSWSERRGGM